MLATNSQKNKVYFSTDEILIAAMWWAQFLPGRKKISFEEINKRIMLAKDKMELMMDALHDVSSAKQTAVSDERYFNFIKILAIKIANLPKYKDHGLVYLQLGHAQIYEPPEIIQEAMKEANIQANAFPYKTMMQIFSNGQIKVGNEILSTNPDIVYYGPKTNFDSAPVMKITGAKFRLIEINLDQLKTNLFAGTVRALRQFDPQDVLGTFDDHNIKITQVCAKVELQSFKGSEQEFLDISNAEWLDILQNPSRLKALFTDSAYIYYAKDKSKCLKGSSFADLGDVFVEHIYNDYYQYATEPVKILSAQNEGTVNTEFLKPVMPNDFIICRKNKGQLNCLTKDVNDPRGFEARFCDQSGNILSHQVYCPGEALPLLPNTPSSTTVMIKAMGKGTNFANEYIHSQSNSVNQPVSTTREEKIYTADEKSIVDKVPSISDIFENDPPKRLSW